MTDRPRRTILEAMTELGVTVEHFGATLLVIRTFRGMSLKRVAHGARISVKSLVELEAGKSLPPDALLLDVLDILEVGLLDFFIALREVKFISDLVRVARRTQRPGQPMLYLGHGLSLAAEPAGGPGGKDDGEENGDPN